MIAYQTHLAQELSAAEATEEARDSRPSSASLRRWANLKTAEEKGKWKGKENIVVNRKFN